MERMNYLAPPDAGSTIYHSDRSQKTCRVGAEDVCDRRPRVLFVSHSAEWKGPTRSLELLLRHLNTAVDPAVIAPAAGPFTARLEELGVPSIKHLRLLKWDLPRLVLLLRRGRFDVVYANNTCSAAKNLLIAAKLARVPFIVHVREMIGNRGWRRAGWIRHADAVVAVSHACAASVDVHLRGRKTAHVVHNGVPLSNSDGEEATRPSAVEMPWRGRGPLLLSLGTVCPRKAQEHAVRAMASVAEAHPGSRLLLVGDTSLYPAYVERIRGLIEQLGLSENVQLTGHRDDVEALLRSADALVHTAIGDPHPRVVLEAMRASLPVFAFDVDGVAETVVHGATGFLIPAGETAELSRALLSGLAQPGLLRTLGRNGREHVERHFSDEAAGKAVRSIILGVLGLQGLRERDRRALGA